MVSYFLCWTLLICFSSFPDEQSQQKVRQLGRITCAAIHTSNEVKCPLLWIFWIYNFSRRILESVFLGNIVNIRNECLFSGFMGEWIVARNKQIAREPLRFLKYLHLMSAYLVVINIRCAFLLTLSRGLSFDNCFNCKITTVISLNGIFYRTFVLNFPSSSTSGW